MAIYVYLPLVEMAEEWKRLVDKAEEDGDSDRLLSKLGVDPRETDIVKAIKRQLQNLEAYGWIESTVGGWKPPWRQYLRG